MNCRILSNLQNAIPFCKSEGAVMFLSCPAKKGTKEGVIGEALRKCALPYVPHPPLRQSAFKNVPIFERLQLKMLQHCFM